MKKLTSFWRWLPALLVPLMLACLALSFVFHDGTGEPSPAWLSISGILAVGMGVLERKYVGRP